MEAMETPYLNLAFHFLFITISFIKILKPTIVKKLLRENEQNFHHLLSAAFDSSASDDERGRVRGRW
jgi:hypothetical protein